MGSAAALPDDLDGVRNALLGWYREHARSFPWRETTDAYAILVSEVMSQQTQLDRIVEPWEAFLERWPTVEALAASEQSAVVGFWSEHRLGYNNRARYLHEAARQVVEEHGGRLPAAPGDLQTLPGVGPYTANAVASFAFNAGGAVVDTNVKRVLHRAFDVPDDADAFERAAAVLLPEGASRDWNNAIMELGGEACGRTPACDDASCPWRSWCTAYATDDFTAPDVPEQPDFEGSRRQFRGRAVRALADTGGMGLDDLGPRVRVDYRSDEHRSWLRDLLGDLADDGLVELDEGDHVAARLLR